MLTDFGKRLESFLNEDQELKRRLTGFKTFSGAPDGHYGRARVQGQSAVARAVKCYPFGGVSKLGTGEMIGIKIRGTVQDSMLLISLRDNRFGVEEGKWTKPHLTVELDSELFWKTILGRHRWLWVFTMEGVEVGYTTHLPHSDWVTLLEILVTMQEVVEFDSELWRRIENQA